MERSRNMRSASVKAYEDTLTKFALWEGSPPEWDQVTAEHIEAFMGRLRRAGEVGQPATQERDRTIIAEFFKFMVAREQLADSPCWKVKPVPVHNRAPKAIPDGVWARLWSSELCDDDRLWLGLGCFAGLRRREIVSLDPKQVDWERGMFVNMERKGGKEEAVEYQEMACLIGEGLPRVLPDPERWLRIVTSFAIMRHDERCLITMDAPTTAEVRRNMSITDPRVPDPGVINKRLAILLVRAGLAYNTFSPHAMRHTCVTNLLRCGVPIEVVSDAVGHENIDTTRRYVKSAGRLAEWRGHRYQ